MTNICCVAPDPNAFPAISTGVYGYPIEAAAAIAVDAVRSTRTDVDEVIFVAFDQETFDAYAAFR